MYNETLENVKNVIYRRIEQLKLNAKMTDDLHKRLEIYSNIMELYSILDEIRGV